MAQHMGQGMRTRYIAEAGLALALVLTLSLKIAFGPAVSAEMPVPAETLVAAFLERQGFAVGPLLPDIDPPMLPAQRPDCNLRVTKVSPSGWHRDVLAQLARPDEKLLFVFRGKAFPSQPVWQTFTDHYRRLLLGYAGFHSPEQQVLGILASQACALGDLPWDEVAAAG